LQVEGQEYDPADMLGWLADSAKDLFVPKVLFGRRYKSMLPKSYRYTGQMYMGDDEACGATQRFILPQILSTHCSQARYMALGLPFCTSIAASFAY